MSPGGRTLLFIHPGGLGDVILSVPAIRLVRQAFPAHACALLAGGEVGRFLRTCGEVDWVLPIEGDHLTSLLAGQEALSLDLRVWLGRCDMAVGWLADPDGRLAATLRATGVKSVIVRSPMSADFKGRHQAERFLETVAAIAPTISFTGWTLRLPAFILAQGLEQVEATLPTGVDLLVAIHPGSGSRHKCCQPRLLAQAVTSLQREGAWPVLVEGPADADSVEAVNSELSRPVPEIRGLDLLAMAGVLAQATLFLGHDSGLAHVSAALGVRTLALFGPTESDRWGPLGAHTRVLHGAPCRCGSWDVVKQCAEKPCLMIPVELLMATCRGLMESSLAWRETQDRAGSDSCHVC